jgi:hypothetical protein
MTSPQYPRRTHRARTILETVGRAYPGAWAAIDGFRAGRGRDLPGWPEWCYCPLAGAYAIVSGGGANQVPVERVHHVGIVGALSAWRMTQGIYRVDPALYAALVDTPLDRDLPREPLYRLPEWCVYVETPDLRWGGERPVHGVWAHLEADTGGGADELRLVLDTARTPAEALDTEHGCVPLPLILGEGSIADALSRVVASGARRARAHGLDPPAELGEALAVAPALWPIVSLLLYLCDEDAEIDGPGRPGNPGPKRTRRGGWRLFAADGPMVWDVGVRLGAALRAAYQGAETEQRETDSAGRARPRGHVRRAHWHTYAAGEGRQERRLRWLPPIAVNLPSTDELVRS